MSQADALLKLFRENGGQLTLGQILERWDILGCKHTGRISEAREMLEKQGQTIKCYINKSRPTENLYVIEPLHKPFFDDKGQAQINLGL